MRRSVTALVAVGLVSASGCVDNVALGNDRESELDPPEPAAEVVDVAEAVAGVSPGLLKPRVMSEADVAAAPAVAPGAGNRCVFRYTRVDHPSFLYGEDGVIKLNGKLVRLPGTGEGRFAAGGLEVTVRLLDEDGDAGAGPVPAEMVVRLPGAPDELGFHGFSTC